MEADDKYKGDAPPDHFILALLLRAPCSGLPNDRRLLGGEEQQVAHLLGADYQALLLACSKDREQAVRAYYETILSF